MLSPSDAFDALCALARHGAAHEFASITTTEAGKIMGCSQQTASRKMLELEREGLVERRAGEIRITKNGIAMLRKKIEEVQGALSKSSKSGALRGILETGFGEGKYYVALPEYSRQLESALGFKPFAGTLNVRLTESDSVNASAELRKTSGIEIAGALHEGRVLGAAKCYMCTVNGYGPCAIIVPQRTHYGPDVLEILAPVSLREKMKLHDRSKVTVTLEK